MTTTRTEETIAAKEAQLKASISDLETHRKAFAAAKEKVDLFNQQIEENLALAQAEEENAAKAKGQFRALLRSGSAQAERKRINELRAEERTAYSVAEEYRAIAGDIELEKDRVGIELSKAANDYSSSLSFAFTLQSEILIDKAFAALPPELFAGYRLLQKVQGMGAANYRVMSQMPHINSTEDYVVREIGIRMGEEFRKSNISMDGLILGELATPLNVRQFEVSPITLKKMMDDLTTQDQQSNAVL